MAGDKRFSARQKALFIQLDRLRRLRLIELEDYENWISTVIDGRFAPVVRAISNLVPAGWTIERFLAHITELEENFPNRGTLIHNLCFKVFSTGLFDELALPDVEKQSLRILNSPIGRHPVSISFRRVKVMTPVGGYYREEAGSHPLDLVSYWSQVLPGKCYTVLLAISEQYFFDYGLDGGQATTALAKKVRELPFASDEEQESVVNGIFATWKDALQIHFAAMALGREDIAQKASAVIDLFRAGKFVAGYSCFPGEEDESELLIYPMEGKSRARQPKEVGDE
jgi:hypothetical protein